MSEEKYMIEEIIDDIVQSSYDIMYAMQAQDREMLKDVLEEYLHGAN